MKIKKLFKWSGHIPVLNSVIEYFQPQLILELGIGNFSTPILINSNAEQTIHIENDIEWFNKITRELPHSQKNNFLYHNIDPSINKNIELGSINDEIKNNLINYYSELKEKIRSTNSNPKMLFVDQFTCARVLSINILSDIFDIVIYHDAEFPDVYNYEKIDKSLYQNFNHHQYITPGTWTGFLINKKFDDQKLISLIIEKSDDFGKTFGFPLSEFKVEKLS